MKICLFLLCSVLFLRVGAQTFELRTVSTGPSRLAIQMRTTAGNAPSAADYITDIVFGIKWPQSANVDLPTTFVSAYNIKKAGTRSSKNGFHYQAFYAEPVGFTIPSSWQSNQWMDILSVPNISGAGLVKFEVCELGFDITTEPNFAVNFIDFVPAITGSAMVTLPVRFAGFDALVQKEHVQLSWSTSMEVNSKKFQVERSFNGQGFETVEELPAAGNSSRLISYESKDADAVRNHKGKIIFYRIAQSDVDGNLMFTDTRKVLIPNGRNTLKLAQNPVFDEALLLYDCLRNDKVVLQIADATGKIILKKEAAVRQGNNQIYIPTSFFSAGVYTIDLMGNHDHQSIKMTKL